jgi:predicted MFS family arabinose efflux permease
MNIWLLLLLSLVLGIVHPFNAISRHTIVPATVPKAEIPTALATDSALYNAARFIGPAIAGYLIAHAGAGYTFIVNAFGILFYIAGLFAMRLSFDDRTGHARGSMLGDITEGLAYVRRHPGIGPLFLVMAVGAIWVRPLQDLLPGFADKVFEAGPTGLGWLTAGMGVGATIAAALVAMYARTRGLTLVVLIAFLANVAATILFCATQWMWLAVPIAALWGGTLTMMSTGTQALVQSSVDNQLRARVMSLYTMIYRGVPAVGAILIGWLADHIGLQLAFMIAAFLCLPAWIKAIRRRDTMTVALEGGSNDIDLRLEAASRAWAGLGYERLVDLRERAAPLAGKVRQGSRSIVERAREARLRDKLPGLKSARRDDLS